MLVRWRVRAALAAVLVLGGCGSSPVETEAVDPTVTLISPEPGAVLQNACMLDPTPTTAWHFDWGDVPTASRYHLFVTADAPNPVVDVSDLAESMHHAETFGYIIDRHLADWVWKVRALVDNQWGPWSEERVFSVEPLNTSCQET